MAGTGKTFTYVAMDRTGTRQTGVLTALSEAQARTELARQGLLAELVQEAKPAADPRSALEAQVVAPVIAGVRTEHLVAFFRQLGAMIRAGVPMVQALETLGSSAPGRLGTAIGEMQQNVLAGRSLSEAMERYPEAFTPLQVNIMKVGEQGGMMDRSIATLHNYLEREVRLRNQFKWATFYPKALIIVATIIIFAANILISLVSNFTGGPRLYLGGPLASPLFLAAFGGALLGLWLFFRIGSRVPQVRMFLHRLYLAIPYFGTTVHMLVMSKFARGFAALYSGGVPIGQSIRLAADACGNDYMAERIRVAADQIEEGRGVADSFAMTGVFSQIALDMARTGESTGSLDALFEHMANQSEEEADVRLRKSTLVLTTVVLILVLLLVGWTIISFWTSYFGRMGYQEALGD
jgi:type II secretory pathway component PulF